MQDPPRRFGYVVSLSEAGYPGMFIHRDEGKKASIVLFISCSPGQNGSGLIRFIYP